MRAIIFEGSTAQRIEYMKSLGCPPFNKTFLDTISYIDDTIECDVAYPAFENYETLTVEQLQKYDLAFWTGSVLNAYDETPEVLQQIEQTKLVFKSGVPLYGSCWGLQMAVVASGGTVARCANGLEIGVSKNLALTDAGKRHPMLEGRGDKPYSAFCVHSAETTILPPTGTTVLVSNPHSAVQGIEIVHDNGIFWGVQYHPEVCDIAMTRSLQRGEIHYRKLGVLKEGQTPENFVEQDMINHEQDLTKDNRIIEIRNFINYFKK